MDKPLIITLRNNLLMHIFRVRTILGDGPGDIAKSKAIKATSHGTYF